MKILVLGEGLGQGEACGRIQVVTPFIPTSDCFSPFVSRRSIHQNPLVFVLSSRQPDPTLVPDLI